MSFLNFTNKFSQSKTLRFELRPQGKTFDNIQKDGLISDDEQRSLDYQEVKKIIDRYHIQVIAECLEGLELTRLDEFEALYYKIRDDNDEKEFINLQIVLRKQIVKSFAANERFKTLFKKELIKDDLPQWLTLDEEKKLVSKFDLFTTYFTGFHENRKNIYTVDAHSTAVAYRLIHDNLPKYLDNLKIYRGIIKAHEELDFDTLEEELKNELQGLTVNEFFTGENFNRCLTQKGIDRYNTVLGGIAKEGQTKLKGMNEYINLYRQKNKLKPRNLPNLKPLYKQILSDRESASFLLDKFENDQELLASLKDFYAALNQFEFHGQKDKNLFLEIGNLFQRLNESDLSKIFYKNDTALTGLSQMLFGDWAIIPNALEAYYDFQFPWTGKKAPTKSYLTAKDRFLKKSDGFSLQHLHLALTYYSDQNELLKEKLTEGIILTQLQRFTKKVRSSEGEESEVMLLLVINQYYKKLDAIFERGELDKKNRKAETTFIKAFLDSVKELLWYIKPLKVTTSEEKDEGFYSDYEVLYDALNQVTPLYNKVRNYLTQKPYSDEKFKLNFENSTLLDGWDANKETDNTGVLLQKEGLFYLAIMNKKHNKVFQNIPEVGIEPCYDKVVYKLLPGANKQLPRVFFAASNIEFFAPSEEVLRVRNTATHSKNGDPQKGFEKEDFNLKDCHTLIDFFKASINKHPDWKNFGFEFSDTSSYEDISGFYREVEHQGYKLTNQSIPVSYINELVDEGKIYLFQIYNKDFSKFSKGKPNLHTLYWKALFEPANLADTVYKLNGQAEIFFRKKSIEYSDEKLKMGHHVDILKDKFDYPIIKDRRFAFDKFQFHVPITMNFKATGSGNLNYDALEYLQNNPDVKIIGLDRGERHLLYLTLIDQQGNIHEQYSLNEIVNEYNGKPYKKDYHKLLDEREGDRAKARENWGTIETIKELKEGYLSQVVHKMANMMVQHNAIVVMEDLNFGFKRGRQKVEKQIYQKFEKMLIDKLSYLVFKDKEANEKGGTLHALQLANKFESFSKLGKQSGFIFYVPAALTSKIDPVTGFVDFLRPKYESVNKAQEFFEKFTSIHFNVAKGWFEFNFDYNNFTTSAEGSRTKWTLCTTPHTRYRWNRQLNNGKGGQEALDVTELLQDLFGEFAIPYGSGGNKIDDIVKQDDKSFYSKLIKYLSVTIALRHNNGLKDEREEDFILSAVANDQGTFFCSTDAAQSLPQDADANGAYHIALKGLWNLRLIVSGEYDNARKEAIKNKTGFPSTAKWLSFAQDKPFKK